MPNLYITPGEIKDVTPDEIRAGTTKYDDAILRIANQISRAIDKHTERHFYPIVEARYFTAYEGSNLEIDPLISITSLKTDDDGDRVYETTWASTDYDLMPFNERGSYSSISITPNGNNAFPPRQARAVEITGVWAKVDDRAAAHENSGQEVEDAGGINTTDTEVTVTDIDGDDLYGLSPVLVPGMLIRIESEYCELTATNTGTEKGTIIRAVNSSTAATHAKDIAIEIWRPPPPVKQAAMIEVVRIMERAKQGFADARANPELGQLVFSDALDPATIKLLEPYEKLVHSDAFQV